MIRSDGYEAHSIWEHSTTVKELYSRRCSREEEEMTCSGQAADLLQSVVSSGDTVLDVGCGSGYLFHSLQKRNLDVRYLGIDASPSLIAIGKSILPAYGLPPENLTVMRIEDLDGSVDHAVCINVLSNIDNFYKPLERLLKCARKSVILRESCHDVPSYRYVIDKYLDPGYDLRVHVNAYQTEEFVRFIDDSGFDVEQIVDRRTGGKAELVIDYPHYWKFFIAKRR